MADAFYEDYFRYIGDTESPTIYHRWCAVSMVGALLGRNVHFPFGHGFIYPNLYILLVGNPGARKGEALKPARNALQYISFDKLAPQRVSPERFLIEMFRLNAAATIELPDLELVTVEELTNGHKPSEIYVVSDEFGDFIRGNTDFIDLLTTLWDNLPKYEHPKIHGKSVYVHEPTVNIIGATTQQSIALRIPVEVIGQGFLSRFILVHSEPTGKKITFPTPPTQTAKDTVTENLQKIKKQVEGLITILPEAKDLLDKIYRSYVGIDDNRFQYYNGRRFTQLMKLAIIFAAMDYAPTVKPLHVLQANTLLYVTEQRMPKALGQFGKSKHSDIANSIIELVKHARTPLLPREIWKHVAQDLDKYEILIEILRGLEAAEKIVNTNLGGKKGFVANSPKRTEWDESLLIQKEFLKAEERV